MQVQSTRCKCKGSEVQRWCRCRAGARQVQRYRGGAGAEQVQGRYRVAGAEVVQGGARGAEMEVVRWRWRCREGAALFGFLFETWRESVKSDR